MTAAFRPHALSTAELKLARERGALVLRARGVGVAPPSALPTGSSPLPSTPRPVPTEKKGPVQRLDRAYPHLHLPTKRLNISLGTRDAERAAAWRDIIDALSEASNAQAFFLHWRTMQKPWSVKEIAAVYHGKGKRRPEDTIRVLLQQTRAQVTWEKALEVFERDLDTREIATTDKQLNQVRAFRRWLDSAHPGTTLVEALTPDLIRAFLAAIKAQGLRPSSQRGASARTRNHYRGAILAFADCVDENWSGLCDSARLRKAVKYTKLKKVEPRLLRWTREEERRYYAATYALTLPKGRGHKPTPRPEVGLMLRVLHQTALDAGQVRQRLRRDHLLQDPVTGKWWLRPGVRPKIERILSTDLSDLRMIPISDELARDLLAHAANEEVQIARCDGLLFGWVAHKDLARAHAQLTNAIGWGSASRPRGQRITLKDLRHAAPLRWSDAKVSGVDISTRLGHENLQTARHYLRSHPWRERETITDEHAAAQRAPAPAPGPSEGDVEADLSDRGSLHLLPEPEADVPPTTDADRSAAPRRTASAGDGSSAAAPLAGAIASPRDRRRIASRRQSSHRGPKVTPRRPSSSTGDGSNPLPFKHLRDGVRQGSGF